MGGQGDHTVHCKVRNRALANEQALFVVPWHTKWTRSIVVPRKPARYPGVGHPWTMPWDFHRVRLEWRGAADFVYSNALDHSFNASLAVSSWLEELAPGGAVLIHWAGGASKATGVHKDTDVFSAGYVRLMEIFSAAGNVTEVVSLPTPHKSWYGSRARKGQTLFVVQAKVATRSVHVS